MHTLASRELHVNRLMADVAYKKYFFFPTTESLEKLLENNLKSNRE